MDPDRGGISSPGGTGRSHPAPDGHTKMCWASMMGYARRGRPPKDFAVSADRARAMLAADPTLCRCQPENRPTRRRR